MHIEVVLSFDDIRRLLLEFTPVRIHMGDPEQPDPRWVELDQPTSIRLVPARGVRAVSTGRIRYGLAGLSIPVSIRNLQVLLEPRIVPAGAGRRLEFKLQIEEADLENVPGLVDRALVGKVNDALLPDASRMWWDFTKTLDRSFPLPERLEPLNHMMLQARDADVSVSDAELRLRLELGLTLSRRSVGSVAAG
jgi:hypothetical protein